MRFPFFNTDRDDENDDTFEGADEVARVELAPAESVEVISMDDGAIDLDLYEHVGFDSSAIGQGLMRMR